MINKCLIENSVAISKRNLFFFKTKMTYKGEILLDLAPQSNFLLRIILKHNTNSC